MGGAIWAENHKAGGATFGLGIRFEKGSLEEVEEDLLFLPKERATEDPDSDEDFPEDEISSEAVACGNNGENKSMKILIVDDCQDTCRLIESYLKKCPYDVDIVNNGVTALEQHATGEYDLILMDIQLPGLDGVSATIEIRNKESESASKTPIFALVGSSSEADGSYLAADFDQCLIKPVSKEKLLEAITTLNVTDKKIVQ